MEKKTKEKKPKKHYAVYYVGKGKGVYAKEYQRTFIRNTWAVSEAKAKSNVRNDFRRKNNPMAYSKSYLGDRLDEGSVTFTYEAVEIE